MNKIYTLTLSGLVLLASPSFGQTVYTVVQPGNWSTPSPGVPIWDGVHGQPPPVCSNCEIDIKVTGTVVLNTSITLTNGSKIVIGAAGSHTILQIPNSGSGNFAGGNNILLDGTTTASNFSIFDATSSLDATSAGLYDGVLQLTPGGGGTTEFAKQYGTAGNLFNGNTTAATETGFGPAVFGASASGPLNLSSTGTLPVILTDFTATVNEGVVDLAWTTTLEINSDRFVVERSANAGADWDAIGTVGAHGNSGDALHYSFADHKPVQGTAEYRLQMVDKDGVYKYSPVKSVRLGAITAVSVYPNPARDFVNVTLGNASGFTVIRLYNQGGQLLQEKGLNNPGGTIVPLAVSGYPEGNYIVVVTGADGSRATSKVLVAK